MSQPQVFPRRRFPHAERHPPVPPLDSGGRVMRRLGGAFLLLLCATAPLAGQPSHHHHAASTTTVAATDAAKAKPTVAAPTFSPSPGAVTSGTGVTLASTTM